MYCGTNTWSPPSSVPKLRIFLNLLSFSSCCRTLATLCPGYCKNFSVPAPLSPADSSFLSSKPLIFPRSCFHPLQKTGIPGRCHVLFNSVSIHMFAIRTFSYFTDGEATWKLIYFQNETSSDSLDYFL